MHMNYIGLLYIWKKNILSYIDLFFRVLQKCLYVSIFCSFWMTQIGTKFWYIFKQHRSDLHTKISRCIQYILFYRTLQEFEYIYCSFLMIEIGPKFLYDFELHRYDLRTKISHRIQHNFFYRALQKIECINVYCFLLKCTASPRNIDMF